MPLGPTSILTTKTKGQHLLARSPLVPQGTRPAFPTVEPSYQPLVPCYTQTAPNLNSATKGNGP